MKRILLVLFIVVPLTFSACQCSEKPEIGPVEEASRRLDLPSSFA